MRKVSVFTQWADIAIEDSDTDQEDVVPCGSQPPSTEDKPRPALAFQLAVGKEHELGTEGSKPGWPLHFSPSSSPSP